MIAWAALIKTARATNPAHVAIRVRARGVRAEEIRPQPTLCIWSEARRACGRFRLIFRRGW